MAKKVAVPSSHLRDMKMFSWGLKVSDYKELFFLTGQVDSGPDGVCRHPNDPVGQTKVIFDSLLGMLNQEGWSVHDVIRWDVTVTKDVDMTVHRDTLYKMWADVFKDVDPKPSAGTLRIVHALARPDFLVEYEILVAR